jgi:alpha-ketoglutarate-dependent dioxygenase FTO
MGKNKKRARGEQSATARKDPSTTATRTNADPYRSPNGSSKHRVNDSNTPVKSHNKPPDKAAATRQLPLPFPAHVRRPEDGAYLRNEAPWKDAFQTALTTAYEGFVVDVPSVLSQQPSSNVDATTLQQVLQHVMRNLYAKDVTQPFGLGTPCAPTYVTRCLLGDAGTTYKYLGLRMFAHAWPNAMALLQQHVTGRTAQHLQALAQQRARRGAAPVQGRAAFDVCLVNCMTSAANLKADTSSQTSNLRTTVSWHADSSLEHFSTIAVYHTIVPSEDADKSPTTNDKDTTAAAADEWSVALRVAHHSEGPESSSQRRGAMEDAVVRATPLVAVSLPSDATYYLLDDFNHHHQHTVLTQPQADSTRYSCTFRLLRDSHNVAFWVARGQRAVTQFHKKGGKLYRSEQLLLSELECEWLRQFYIQGQTHYDLLWPRWGASLQELLRYWSLLERRTFQTVQFFQAAARGACMPISSKDPPVGPPPSKAERKARDRQRKAVTTLQDLLARESSEADSLYDMLATLLDERANMRDLWAQREDDPAFYQVGPEQRPLPLPFVFDVPLEACEKTAGASPMPGTPEGLRTHAKDLRAYGKAFASGNAKFLPPPVETVGVAHKSPDDTHSKSLDWQGWTQYDFGLEMQSPWADAILKGEKTIETRAYDLPPGLIGKRIAILQTPQGESGKSAMGNQLAFATSNAQVVGWCRFSKAFHYTNRNFFMRDEAAHLVTRDSDYGWKEGITKDIYGWLVEDCVVVEDGALTLFESATRRMRSLYQLQRPLTDNQESRSNSGRKKKKKRRKMRERT